MGFEMSVKVLNPSSPLRFSTRVRMFYHFHDALTDLFSVKIYASVHFLHYPCFSTRRAPGRFFPCSVGGSSLSLVAALVFTPIFTPTTSCPRSSLIFDFVHSFLFSIIFRSSFSFHASFPHARTLCQLWYNVRTSVSITFAPPPPPLFQWRHIC